MKNLLWISTGGTIACPPRDAEGNGISPIKEQAALYDMLSALPRIDADIEITSFAAIDSTEISPDIWISLSAEINRRIVSGKYDGIVITHGTDTMAYTASALYFMLQNPPVPVVLTGSQLPFFAEDSDAPQNLYNAFLTAMSDINEVSIVFDRRIIPALYAYKAYSENKIGFISVQDYYGYITKAGIEKDYTPNKAAYPYRYKGTLSDKVTVIKITPCTTPDLLLYAAKIGCKGIILEVYGMGGIPSRLLPALSELISAGVKIDVISQCLYDGVNLEVYKVGRDAEKIGISPSGCLTVSAALCNMMIN